MSVLSATRILSSSLTAALQCKSLAALCMPGEAASTVAALLTDRSNVTSVQHTSIAALPQHHEQLHRHDCILQQACSSSNHDSKTEWSGPQHSQSYHSLLKACKLHHTVIPGLQSNPEQWRSQAFLLEQKGQQHSRGSNQQHQQQLQPNPFLVLHQLDLQLPASSDGGLAEPVLCVKRTYQPNIHKGKRKHGFLKR